MAEAAAPLKQHKSSPRLSEKLRYYLPTILIALGILAVWEIIVRLFNIQQFILPRPTAILEELFNEIRLAVTPGGNSFLFQSTATTLTEAVGGYFLGCGAGILIALVTARWTIINEALMPFAIAANSVPIVAFAPITNNWFGAVNPASKMVIVAVIVFFPTMINTVRGLTLIEPRQLELMESYAAKPTKILLGLRIPNALPFIFSALRVACSLSVIGAIVGEFFGGQRTSLGQFIGDRVSKFNFAQTWTAIIMASIIGIAFYYLVLLVERWVMPWHISYRQNN